MGKHRNDMLHIRLSTELKDQLKEIAESQNRSVTNLVETVLKHYVSEENTKSEQVKRLRDNL